MSVPMKHRMELKQIFLESTTDMNLSHTEEESSKS